MSIEVSVEELVHLHHPAKSLILSSKKRRLRGQNSGAYASMLKGRGIDFAEVRAYQEGDDIKHMDWRVTARTGKPHTKQFHEERERPVFFLIDLADSMFFGTRVTFKSKRAAQAAMLLAWASVQRGDKIGAIVARNESFTELQPRARSRGGLQLAKTLSLHLQNRPQHFSLPGSSHLPLRHLSTMVKPGSLIVVISDFYSFDASFEQHLGSLARHNDILCCTSMICLKQPHLHPNTIFSPMGRSISLTTGVIPKHAQNTLTLP